MVTNEYNNMTDGEIIKKANQAIIKELGVSGYMRYLRLRQPNHDGRDYVKEQEELFKEMTVEQLSQMARKHWEEVNPKAEG